ncbi:MAG: 2-isopropylmalate synthase [Methanobrevibacter sp.]|nr:2-isopropylmalate synthase [Methanobrevibacter sp.]
MYNLDIESIKKQNMDLADKIYIFDTTLRDGEQAPGLALTVDEKIQIAQKIDNIGVDKIEAGFPASSTGEVLACSQIKEVIDATAVGLARTVKNDVDAVLDADLDYMHTFIGTSPLHRDYKLKMDKESIIETAVAGIEYGKDHGLTVEFSAEDATRTERDFLIDVYKAVVDAGVDFINVPDTVGVLTPIITKALVSELKSHINIPISVHFHNDFGLATANTLTAIENGASQAHVTVNGIGERTGNASIEELVVTLKAVYGIDIGIDTTQLYNLSDFVGRITGIKMPINKPIVGENAFAHESGIHVHGILKNSLTYEPISPELVGHSRKIVIGKHTGANSLKSKLEEYNIELTDDQFEKVFNQVKALGDKGKTITDYDLKALAITQISAAKETPIKLLGLGLFFGANVSPTATVKLEIDGVEKEVSATGVGNVDAALNAIRSLISDTMDIELEEYNLEAITGGTDALAEVFVITSDSKNKSIGRATNEDIVMASVEAVLDSINKLLLISRSDE